MKKECFNEKNRFHHKNVEKLLFSMFVPEAPDERRARTFLRRQARTIEKGYKTGARDAKKGRRLVALSELSKNGGSPMAQSLIQIFYDAYKSGYEDNRKAVN